MSWKIVIDSDACEYKNRGAGGDCCGLKRMRPCTEATCPLRAKEEGDERRRE